uniref:Reverse transcriptase domain-containing protein n=1 Tax=Tanacetum cinerariifolium TaxID=118510 RepID=A0A6L2L214_TANCI|nr:reverse transcriptase domain-containing protein [Tanacetum cinerariifolium]
MTLELADRSISCPVEVAEDVYVKVGERTLHVGKEAITFNLDQTSRYSANCNDMTAKRIDVIDMACEEYSQEVLSFSDVIASGNPTPYYDLIVSTTSSTLTPFENIDFLLEEVDAFLALEDYPTLPKVDQSYLDSEGDILLLEAFLNDDPSLPSPNQGNYLLEVCKELKICEAKYEKSSIDEPSEVELKDLPPHLKYAFLEGDDKLPVIIAKFLSMEEKTAFITVLKSYKRAITWKLSDIKGIDPEFYTHKILMEEDFEPAVQHQRRVNSKIHDVIKQEVLKLLDAGLIYPISDSPWVSPVHCVPKKGGFKVVENKENEVNLVSGYFFSTNKISCVVVNVMICTPLIKTGTRLRAAHEVPMLTVTASRVIEMEDPAAATDSSGVPSTIERSPLDFANENPSQQSTGPKDQGQEAVAYEVLPPENVTTTGVTPEAGQAKGIAATGPHVVKEHRKRGNDRINTNAPPKVLRRDHVDARPTESTHKGKSHAAIGLGMGSTRPVPMSQGVPVDMSDPDPLSFADPQLYLLRERSWTEIQNQRIPLLPPWSGHLKAFIGQNRKYNVNLARQVAMGSQLRLRFEQEAKLLKKSVAQVTHRDKRIQTRENKIKNLETLLEAETNMKKAAEGKSAELNKELENLRALFLDLQMSNNQQRCAEMDARLDVLSIDFDEELYSHMLTAIVGPRWVIKHGLRLPVMKSGESTELRQVFADVVSAGIAKDVVSVGIAKGISEGLKHGVEHKNANLSLEAIEAYDPEAEAKYIAAFHALKDLKYPIVDQLEILKDAPMDVIMASLHLKSDTEDDAL